MNRSVALPPRLARLAAAVFLAPVLLTGCSNVSDDGDLTKIAVGPPPGGYPSSSAPAPSGSGSSGTASSTPDLCTLNPPEDVLALLGIPGTAFTDPALTRIAKGKLKDDPNARVCVYLVTGNMVRFSTLGGYTRSQFDTLRQKVLAASATSASPQDGDLPGVGDTAFSAHAADGETMVYALVGDTKIQAGAKNVDRAKLGALVKRIAAQPH